MLSKGPPSGGRRKMWNLKKIIIILKKEKMINA